MASAPAEPELAVIDSRTTAVVRGVVPVAGLTDFFDSSFRTLPAAISSQGVRITGPAFGFYHRPPDGIADLEVGFTTDRPIAPADEVVPSSLPGGRVARLVHHGGFDGLGASWERLRRWIEAHGLHAGPAMWESYLVEPSPTMNPDDLRTELVWPLTD